MYPKYKIFLLIVACCLLLVVCCWFYYDFQNKKFEVIFFDVGQGDAALINLPGDNEILIDGGPDMSVLYKLGKYLSVYNRDIELMILTHPHADHVTGLVEVLQRYDVEAIMYTKVKYESGIYDEFIKIVKDIKIIKNEKIYFGENVLETIYPWEDFEGREFENQNDGSIVTKFTTQDNIKFLFMGDIEMNIEQEILDKYVGIGRDLSADVLKIGHHGSDTSSNTNFVQAVNPSWAIISCGQDNKFGHPSLRTVRRLERQGSQVLRTDEDGDIIFKINKTGELELK